MKRLASALLISICGFFSGCSDQAPTNTSKSVTDAEWSTLPMRQLIGKYYSPLLLEFITTADEQTLSPGDLAVAGYALSMGIGVEKNRPRGMQMVTASCEQEHLRGCALQGYLYVHSGSYELQTEAAPILTTTCEAGNMWACSTLVTVYTYGVGVDIDPDRATQYANRSCGYPRELLCSDAALALRDINKTDSLRLHKKSCDADNAVACLNLAGAYSRGNFLGSDPKEIGSLFDKSCQLGLDTGCWGYLSFFTERETNHRDPAPYIEASDRVCQLGQAQACAALSSFFAATGENKTYQNKARALEYAVLACDLGNMHVCMWAGKWYRDGFGTSPNLDAALNTYMRVCRSGDELIDDRACRSVAELEATGTPAAGPVDLPSRACELGSAQDCRIVAWMYAEGDSVAANPLLAADFFKAGCDLDYAISCLDLASLYHWAKFGIEKDLDLALTFYQKSCALDFEFGCEELSKFYENAG